jgi:hypothetical protein
MGRRKLPTATMEDELGKGKTGPRGEDHGSPFLPGQQPSGERSAGIAHHADFGPRGAP